MNDTQLFTTYFKNPKEELHNFYIKELLPTWFEYNSKYLEYDYDVWVYTNVPDEIPFKCNICYKQESKAKLDLDSNIMSTQIGCWYDFINDKLHEQQVGIYLDPDAFMFNNKLIEYSKQVKDYCMTKKKNPHFHSDAGISIFRNTPLTRKYIDKIIEEYKKTPWIKSIAEETHTDLHQGDNNFYIKWSDINILLRGMLCGKSIDIDCVHGSIKQDILKDTKVKDLILKKEQLRHLVY